MVKKYDVVVVGGGPAGSATANLLSHSGYSVAVMEEHAEVGKPVSCAGLVTERVLDMAGIDDSVIINRIRGAHVHSPGGRKISIGGDRTHAFVIDRERFDKEMADMAISEGAEYMLNWKVSEAYKKDGEIVVAGKEKIRCRALVGADGARSTIARCFNFPEPREYIYAMQTVVPYEMEKEFVEIFLGNNIAPKFFAWLIPEGKKARIGVGVGKGYNPREYFEKFLKIVGAGKEKMNAGIIPLGLRSRFSQDNIFLVGDAAAQVKATSGGGIYPGLVGADILASSIKKFMEGDGHNYEKEYMKKFGKELKKGMFFRKIFLRADDKKMDAIFKSIDERVIETINVYGDIDYPSKLAGEIIKRHPKLLKFLLLPL